MMDRKELKYASLMEAMEKHLGVSDSQIREHEFAIFVQLDFNLFIPPEEYLPHLDRILMALDFKDFQEYVSFSAVHGNRERSYSSS